MHFFGIAAVLVMEVPVWVALVSNSCELGGAGPFR